MKARRLFGWSRAVVVLVVTAFVVGGASAGASTHVASGPQRGGTLTIVKNAEQALGWDPVKLQGVPNFTSIIGDYALYDTLFYEDFETSKLVPRIGTSLTSSDNGLTWTLKLHSGVKFSDGTLLDAGAVKFNWERIADPVNKAPAASSANVIQSMEVADPTTLRVVLKSADPNWNKRVAYFLSSIASPTALRTLGDGFGTKPVGAGPFLLKEWVRENQWTFERNPSYWQKGLPYVDTLIAKIIPDETQRLNTLLSGGANLMNITTIPDSVEQARQAGYKVLSMTANGGGLAMAFNNAKAPFNDVRVRKAIDLTLDRQEFVKTRRLGDPAFAMKTLDLPGTPFYDKSMTIPKTDLAAAQKLVDQVVAETGKPIQFTLTAYTPAHLAADAETILAQLGRLKNVEVKIESFLQAEVIRRYSAGDYQALSLSVVRWNEPAIDMTTNFLSTSPFNFWRYSNPAVDAALRQLATATDQKTREQLVHTVEENVLNDSPVAYYARFPSYQLVDKTVKNYKNYFDQRPLLDQVWLAQKNR